MKLFFLILANLSTILDAASKIEGGVEEVMKVLGKTGLSQATPAASLPNALIIPSHNDPETDQALQDLWTKYGPLRGE